MSRDELAEAADRLAEAAADDATDDENGETAAPILVKVNLGDSIVELPEEQAAIVRQSIDRMAGRYGSELEQLRRNAQYAAQPPPQYVQPSTAPPAQPQGFVLPETDLMFQNKKAWETEFDRQLTARESRLRADTEALVQTALGVVQTELNAREARAQAQEYESELFAGVLDNHESLRGKETFFWSVMDEIYDDIRHLPANVAYDRAGEIAESRLAQLGVAMPANGTPAQPARTPTPRVLSSGSRSSASAGPPARVSISDLIQRRQDGFLGRGAPPAK